MARTRNYRAEYKRRIANAAKRGLTRSQARGHARHNESPIKPARSGTIDPRLEAGLKSLAESGAIYKAAKNAGVSTERLRRFLRENALAERSGRTWRITDNRLREMIVISDGTVKHRLLLGRDQASLNSRHLNVIKAFLNSNDIDLLAPFEGQSVIDAKGKAHLLETDPNEIHRLAAAGGEVFHDVYRLIF